MYIKKGNRVYIRFPTILRIDTDGIAEGLTLHDIVMSSASGGGGVAVRRNLKTV